MIKRHWDNFNKVRNAAIHNDSIKQRCIDNGNYLPLQFSVLVWNIFKRNGAFQFDLDLLKLLEKTDIFCLQEVLSNDTLFLPEEIQKINFNYAISYLRKDKFCEGVLTASKYTQSKEAHSLLSLTREPVTKTPKAALISFYPLQDGRQLLVINIHMLLFKRKKSMLEELQQVLDITRQYKEWPAIFAGDFNTYTARQRELVDIKLAEEGYDRCFPQMEPRAKRFLDHIYVRGMKKTRVKILDEITSSDHYPLFCELEII